MSVPFTRKWRAPKWMPLFIRHRFLGVWTQAEVDRINEAAEMDYAEFRRFVEPDDGIDW